MAAYNRLEHALARVAVHAGAAPERCTAHLKAVQSQAAWFDKLHAEAVNRKTWIAGAVYKTKAGVKLKESELIAAFVDKAKLADDRRIARYCNARAATDK